jgi:hypothetical protein
MMKILHWGSLPGPLNSVPLSENHLKAMSGPVQDRKIVCFL